jgi:hypothetical protein
MAKKSTGGSDWAARQAAQDEQNRQNNIRSGTANINHTFDSQFNDDFYTKRRQSFLDYANPQLEDQYADTRKQLTYWLDGRGLLDSSIRADKEAELQKKYDLNRRSVADQALDFENTTRNQVSDARAGLVRDLTATGDASGAQQAAVNRAGALSQPATFSPLASLFGDFTGALATQANLERGEAYSGGMIKPAFNTGLFTPKNSVVNQP